MDWSPPGSLQRSSGDQPTARFKVTDGAASVDVTYKGILPDLFREGQGVVALGNMQPDGVFRAVRGAGQARRVLHAQRSRGRIEAVGTVESGRRPAAAGLDLEYPGWAPWNAPVGSPAWGRPLRKAPREKATIETLPAGNPTAETSPAGNNSIRRLNGMLRR